MVCFINLLAAGYGYVNVVWDSARRSGCIRPGLTGCRPQVSSTDQLFSVYFSLKTVHIIYCTVLCNTPFVRLKLTLKSHVVDRRKCAIGEGARTIAAVFFHSNFDYVTFNLDL